MILGIYKYAFYKSPNIGIFVKCNDHFIVLPLGFAPTKTTLHRHATNVTFADFLESVKMDIDEEK